MQIWVDADACPKVIKEVLFKVAERRKVKTTLVANSGMAVPASQYIDFIKVGAGFGAADKKIAEQVQTGDLVVTADVPLADVIVEKGATGLNPRGQLYTEDNIKGLLRMRHLMEELRSGGMVSGGPAPLGARDKQEFTNQLDKFVTRRLKEEA
ncbi:YaiI/YqxD family protein [Halodesulfovibrio spirochaetisodalis]|uniref:UPF0178 protein SP90_09415 n=1 Tax=Halodesulfovibrio spirochaetisodalis TaxID=1560234 RepID=A0A1B7XCI3_9BACT|nr:YaiI/YqxD family protein [Halodesulfovibrio spirochaetisodalis]OBQ51590.1 hypothetical protein SP90_09415 [Halodesulfovibrio spirochaetisodalis]